MTAWYQLSELQSNRMILTQDVGKDIEDYIQPEDYVHTYTS